VYLEREAHKRADLRTPYWDWTFRDGEAHYHKYCGTPPEHLLFGLRAALDMIFAEGLWTGLDFGLDR
jgi:alanine-glyoxylate transaminase/serine-glyoxylate transaminase/serine-pyruvate transaminase